MKKSKDKKSRGSRIRTCGPCSQSSSISTQLGNDRTICAAPANGHHSCSPPSSLVLGWEESVLILEGVSLGQWLQIEYDKVTPASTIGKAIQYAPNRWKNLSLYLTDGKIESDNNLVVNSIRPIAIGRNNYLFAGSHESARRKAMFYTFFAACKQHNIDPEKWLNEVFNHIQDCKLSQLHELMPQNWKEPGIGK